MRRLALRLIDPFRRADGRPAWATIVAFVAIGALLFANAWLHDPRVGYDAAGHRGYTKVLSEWRLPTPPETHEFFSPPLPYVPAAIARHYVTASKLNTRLRADWALKVGQLVQAVAGVALLGAMLAVVCQLRGRRDAFASFVALLTIGSLPVFYRSFAMVRGEPFLALFATLGVALAIRTYLSDRRPTIALGLATGVVLGLAALSRQWAFFLLPALAIVGVVRLVRDVPNRRATLAAGVATLLAFAVVGLPFYIHLQLRYGSMRAFNRNANDVLVNQSNDEDEAPATAPSPIVHTSLADALRSIVRRPLRDSLADHRVLLAYVDTWGDYWQYFLIYAREKNGSYVDSAHIDGAAREGKKSNINTFPPTLARANLVGLVPTLAMFAATIVAFVPRREGRSLASPLVACLVLSSIAGYAWFVTSYRGEQADTVKATYLLQIFPLLAILLADAIGRLNDRRPTLAKAVIVALIVAAAANAPLLVTRSVRVLISATDGARINTDKAIL